MHRPIFGVDKVENGTFLREDFEKWLKHCGVDMSGWAYKKAEVLWEEVEKRKCTLQRIDGVIYRCVQAVRMWIRPHEGSTESHLTMAAAGGGAQTGRPGSSGHGSGRPGSPSATTALLRQPTGSYRHATNRSPSPPPASPDPVGEGERLNGGDEATPWVWMQDGEPPTHAAIRWALHSFAEHVPEGEEHVRLSLDSLRHNVATYQTAEYPKLLTRHKLHQIALVVDGLPSATEPFTTKNREVRWEWRKDVPSPPARRR